MAKRILIVISRFLPFHFFREQRGLLEKCAQTTLSSKLIARQREFFAKIVVDAVLILDDLLPFNM